MWTVQSCSRPLCWSPLVVNGRYPNLNFKVPWWKRLGYWIIESFQLLKKTLQIDTRVVVFLLHGSQAGSKQEEASLEPLIWRSKFEIDQTCQLSFDFSFCQISLRIEKKRDSVSELSPIWRLQLRNKNPAEINSDLQNGDNHHKQRPIPINEQHVQLHNLENRGAFFPEKLMERPRRFLQL